MRFALGLFISFFALSLMASDSEPLRMIGRLTVTALMAAIAYLSETTYGKVGFTVLAIVNLLITLGRAGFLQRPRP